MIHSINSFKLFQSMFVNPCVDQVVGTICYNRQFTSANGKTTMNFETKTNHTAQSRRNIDYSQYSKGNNKTIVILLESPHIDEFNIQGQTYTTAPAWGKTGTMINKYFILALNNSISAIQNNCPNFLTNITTYDVLLVNAIQYQCSLGMRPINIGIRNKVFACLWNKTSDSFRQDLIERLKILNPDLIINACTSELKKRFCNNKAIIPSLANCNVMMNASSHPSVWNRNTKIF